jgi:hypothetical protein
MGKSPKADSKHQPLDPPPQDPFEAKEAIQKGQVAPIGSYLRYDLPQILNLLADQLDVPNGDESRVEPSKIESAPKDHPTKTDSIGHDWDSNTSDVLSCIEDGKPAPPRSGGFYEIWQIFSASLAGYSIPRQLQRNGN